MKKFEGVDGLGDLEFGISETLDDPETAEDWATIKKNSPLNYPEIIAKLFVSEDELGSFYGTQTMKSYTSQEEAEKAELEYYLQVTAAPTLNYEYAAQIEPVKSAFAFYDIIPEYNAEGRLCGYGNGDNPPVRVPVTEWERFIELAGSQHEIIDDTVVYNPRLKPCLPDN